MRFSNFFYPLLGCFVLCSQCKNQSAPPPPVQTSTMPGSLSPNLIPTTVKITDLHCWRELGNFFVTGICDNTTDNWQKIWLRMQPIDSLGQLVAMTTLSEAIFPTFSEAVPPRGRTSFFYAARLTDFTGIPDSAHILAAGAEPRDPGAMIIIQDPSNVRMMARDTAGNNTSGSLVETGWQCGIVMNNPLDKPAIHPRVEALVYGTDKRLWLAMLLNPEDPELRQILTMAGAGPLQPQEKRRLDCRIYYYHLPSRLQQIKIGRVDFLAFDARAAGNILPLR